MLWLGELTVLCWAVGLKCCARSFSGEQIIVSCQTCHWGRHVKFELHNKINLFFIVASQIIQVSKGARRPCRLATRSAAQLGCPDFPWHQKCQAVRFTLGGTVPGNSSGSPFPKIWLGPLIFERRGPKDAQFWNTGYNTAFFSKPHTLQTYVGMAWRCRGL